MKEYIKTSIKKIEVDEQIIRMFTRQGFIDVFWEELKKQRKENPRVSEKCVFDYLNQRFYDVFGEYRYSSYDSFRQRLNKSIK